MATWTEPARNRLVELYATKSAGAIAGQLHDEGLITVTRNAVIGMAHRLALAKKGKATHIDPERVRARRRAKLDRENEAKRLKRAMMRVKMDEATRERLRSEEVEPRHISLLELDADTCRFPYGAWPPFTFCGRPVMEGSPYCEHHTALCGVRRQ